MLYLCRRQPRRQKLSDKITLEEGIDVADGDCVIVIQKDGSIGQVILPEINDPSKETKGYKMTLKLIEIIDKEKGAMIRDAANKKRYN